jgi:glycosyltransferase involved in cell wall biosynthesis
MIPKISVIMPVYNSENYIDKSIKSILDQTYRNFEFIIINDGSTDSTRAKLSAYEEPRIKIYDNESNIGYVLSLNRALTIARGEYIARMDADDISLPERLEVQVGYMDQNPDIGVCGTYVKFTGSGKGNIWKPLCNHNDIICNLFFTSSLAHPSVMMRKKILDQYNITYDNSYYGAEDYHLWVQISRYSRLANIDKVLLLYTKHENQVSSVKKKTQSDSADRVRLYQLVRFMADVTDEDIEMHNLFGTRNIDAIKLQKDRAIKWLQKLSHINRESKLFPEPEFSNYIEQKVRWVNTRTEPKVLKQLDKFVKIPGRIQKKLFPDM